MDSMEEQCSKAEFSISLTEFGIIIDFREIHKRKVFTLIFRIDSGR